jgi:hypothetical protein
VEEQGRVKIAVTLTRDELLNIIAAFTVPPPEWAGAVWPPDEIILYVDPANITTEKWEQSKGFITVRMDERHKPKFKRQFRNHKHN